MQAQRRHDLAALREQIQRVLGWFTGRVWPDQCQLSWTVLGSLQEVLWQWRQECEREEVNAVLLAALSSLAEHVDDLLIELSWFQEQCRHVCPQTVAQQQKLLRKLRGVVVALERLLEE